MSIRVENVSRLYGTQLALDDVSFEIGTGEIVGFLGPNGAGKSTMMKIITGYLPASSGKVWVKDEEISENSVDIRKKIGYLPEHNPLYTDMYIREYLEFVAGVYHLPNKKKRVAEMVEMTGLGPEQHKKIGALSKGFRQRVGLAQALIHDPDVLILDEPATGLDPNQLEEIRSLIRSISQNKTVMLSTHIMQEVEAVCNRVIIISHGKLVADETSEQLRLNRSQSVQEVLVEFAGKIDSSLLNKIPGVLSMQSADGNRWFITAEGAGDIRPALFHFAVKNGLVILTLQENRRSLENVFRELTRE